MRSVLASILLLGCSSSTDPTTADAGGDASQADAATTDSATTAEASGDTWKGYSQGFFTKYCVECHGATSSTRNYTTLTDVKRDASLIACGVATAKLAGCGSFPPPKQFPIANAGDTNPRPTDDERARLVAWIAAGLPE